MDFFLGLIFGFTYMSGLSHSQQTFRTQPMNVTVRVGSSVLLKCEVLRVSGSVQWVKDGLLLGPERSLPGFPTYKMVGNQNKGQYHLQVDKVSLEDDGPYECQAGRSESSEAVVSHTVWINVLIPPQVPVMVAEVTDPWVVGEEYTVTCVAPDGKPAADVFILRDGVELSDIDTVTIPGSHSKLTSAEAVVTVRAQSSDNRQALVCRVLNPALTHALETRLVMNVLFPPQPPAIEGLDSSEVTAGTTLHLMCVSRGGNPLATLHWTKNDEVLSTSWEVDTVSHKSSSSLSFQVKPEDNQVVLCCESVNQVSRRPLSVSRKLTVHFEPAEIKVLGSFRAIEGKDVTLCCLATSSNPPVQIRWWLGFRELNQTVVTMTEGSNGGMETMSNLTHTVSQEENGLPLTCEAFNTGTRFSKTKTTPLQVFYPPQKIWVVGPPESVPLRSGSTTRLICFSTGGNPTGRLTWLKDGKSVEAQKQVPSDKGVSRELILTLHPSDNMATYRCDATNEAQKVLSAQMRLRVQFPAISVKIVPKQKEIRAGETLTLECISGSSNPRANLSWSLGAERLEGVVQAPRRAEFSGMSVRSVVSLRVSSQHDGQRVICQAFSHLLSEGVNSFYKLDVLFPPEFGAEQPLLVQTVEDEMVLIPLTVSANPPDMTCVWSHRGVELLQDRESRFHMKDGLEIWNVSRRDAGSYSVQCENAEGKKRITITLDVHYAPHVRIAVAPVYVDQGGTADLQCEADANPVRSGMFSWKWLGEEGDDVLGSQTEDGATGWLTITGATRSHAGRYRCTVDNGVAPTATTEVQLIVRFKPEIRKGSEWSKVASGGDGSSSAQVVCQAEGLPKVEFSWAKNGITVDFTNTRYSEQTVREGWLHTSTVTVVNVSAVLDYATFTCTARNALGEDTLDVQLLSTNHPDPPTQLQLISVSHNSVTLQWMPGFDGGLEQRFRVRYLLAGSSSHRYVDVHPPRALTFTVSSLQPNTDYNISVNALNVMGESQYTHVLTVTTRVMPVYEEPPTPDQERNPEGGLPVSVLLCVCVLVGVMLLMNTLGCALALCWRRRRHLSVAESLRLDSEGKKSEEEQSVSTLCNRYEHSELINTSALRTLLLESGSECESTLYESYAQEFDHHYYSPLDDFYPSLSPVPEQSGTHEYEEVSNWTLYEGLSPNLQCSYQMKERDVCDWERRLPDSELPFHLRGELV